ncbi:MAG: ribbon-helix-helix protein, CopG family [Acidimicrobiia bacterium]|nr:ribbon-helix-helix protein, CopG family [Acidimicrobiia bacterium]
MSRSQTLVQLSDELLSLLDQRAAATGKSRSHFIREAIERYLADDLEAALDLAIEKGYELIPAEPPDATAIDRAIASIEEEPW